MRTSRKDSFTPPIRLDPGYWQSRPLARVRHFWTDNPTYRALWAIEMAVCAFGLGTKAWMLFVQAQTAVALGAPLADRWHWNELAAMAAGLLFVGYYVWYGWRYWGSWPWARDWTAWYAVRGTPIQRWYFRWGRAVVVTVGLLAGFLNAPGLLGLLR